MLLMDRIVSIAAIAVVNTGFWNCVFNMGKTIGEEKLT